MERDHEADRARFEKTVISLNAVFMKLKMQILGKNSLITSMRNTIAMLEDVESQRDQALDQRDKIEVAKTELQNELTSASEYIIDIENKFYASRVECLELLRQLKEKEASCQDHMQEIETLRNYIIDLKSRIAVYIPVKNDQVDKRIAEYINNYPDR